MEKKNIFIGPQSSKMAFLKKSKKRSFQKKI